MNKHIKKWHKLLAEALGWKNLKRDLKDVEADMRKIENKISPKVAMVLLNKRQKSLGC